MSDESIKKNISLNIAKYRELSGMTQKELAKRLNITPSRVSNWEQGANCPTIDILFEVCEVLGVSINDIYGVYPDAKIKLSYNEVEHIKKYRDLDSHGKEIVNMVLLKEHERCLYMGENHANSSNIIELPIFLAQSSKEYLKMKNKIKTLKEIKKSDHISSHDIARFLWSIGYDGQISISDIASIMLELKIPSPQLYSHIHDYLTGNYSIVIDSDKNNAIQMETKAAHPRTDIEIPEGVDTSDNDIMDSEDF